VLSAQSAEKDVCIAVFWVVLKTLDELKVSVLATGNDVVHCILHETVMALMTLVVVVWLSQRVPS
jgi:hypothetical protein